MVMYDVVFALASVCFLLPIYAEMFEDINIQQFSSTLPPDNREFEVFEFVWYNGSKHAVTWYSGANYLWLHLLGGYEQPFKVNSRLVKKVIRAD